MTEPVQRRPLPALIFLLALTLLTAIVWWRVATRHESSGNAASPSCNASATPSVVPPPAKVSVTVLNATAGYKTPLAGIATKAAEAFKAAGFVINGTPTNDNGTGVPGVAVLRFGPDEKAEALLVSYYLPGSQLAEQTNDQGSVIVSLGLKYTGLATTAQVNAALAKNKVTVSTVSPSAVAGC